MNVVDSSGWLEYFGRGTDAEFFRVPIIDSPRLVVPTLCLYEVYKRMYTQIGRAGADRAIASMKQGQVVDFGERIALEAARIGIIEQLAAADSIILATARSYGATLWTQDSDFVGLPDVEFIEKVN